MAVNSSDLPMVREGQSVSVTVRGGSSVGTGKVIFVSPLLDKETRAARVVAALDNPDRLWRPGSFVTAAIGVESRQVPVAATAVQTVDKRKVVFVRTSDGFEKREVVLGRRDDGMVEVTSGLARSRYWRRPQLVAERINDAKSSLPPGVEGMSAACPVGG